MSAIRSAKRAAVRAKKVRPKNFHPLLATPGRHPLFDIADFLSSKPLRHPPIKLRLPKSYAPRPVSTPGQSIPIKSRAPKRGIVPRQIPVIRPNSPRTPGSKSRNSSLKKR